MKASREEHSNVLKPYSTKELTELYGVSRRTLATWIKPFSNEIGTKRGRYYTVMQVKIIFDKLGYP